MLRQRPTGLWEYRISRDGVRTSFYGKSPREAVLKAEQPKASKDRLHAYLHLWLEKRKGTIKAKTWRTYKTTVEFSLIPFMPDIKLADIRSDHIEGLRAKLEPAGYQKAKTVLGTALEYAVQTNLITANPCRNRSLRQPVERREWVILSRAQTRRLLKAARSEPYEALYVVAAVLGLRQGEILGLRWRDVDLERGLLHVRHSVGRDYDGVLRLLPPKTKRAERTIHLPDVVLDALRRIPFDERRLTTAGPDHADLLFKTTEGEILDGSTITRHRFPPVLEKAGLGHMRFHDLRHSAITAMLEDGVSPRAVADIVGHSDVSTTLSLYASTTRGMHDAATAALNARYS